MPSNGTAIVVSACSAAIAMSSMLVSLATYRRGGPRLKVRAEIAPHNAHDAYRSGDVTKWRQSWHVHVINRSSATVEVEKVEVLPWVPPPTGRIYGRIFYKKILTNPTIRSFSTVIWLEGEDKKKLEGFGGARWVLSEKMSSVPIPDMGWANNLLFLTLRVTLTNGREAYSTPFRFTYLAKRHHTVFTNLTRLAEREKEDALKASGQLSFDDLVETE